MNSNEKFLVAGLVNGACLAQFTMECVWALWDHNRAPAVIFSIATCVALGCIVLWVREAARDGRP